MRSRELAWKPAARLLVTVLLVTAAPLLAGEDQTAETLTKAALFIFDRDFATGDVEHTFTAQELEILADQRKNLVRLVDFALDRGDSATAADVIGYFRLHESLPALRHRFLEPGSLYGWEGTPPGEAGQLEDVQYVYHSRYLAALNRLFPGEDLARKLRLSRQERANLVRISKRTDAPFGYWGQWMRIKLGF